MYSFFIKSHQKIDRAAYKSLVGSTNIADYLSLDEILLNEGNRGPDSVELKRRGNQPRHFYNPERPNEEFLTIIKGHYQDLVQGLTAGDRVKASTQAAWLAHALVDGLTPAHHYPYEDRLASIRNHDTNYCSDGKARHNLIVKGDNRRETIKLSMQLIGPRGLIMRHTAFEFVAGLATSVNNKSGTVTLIGQTSSSDAVVQTFQQYAETIYSNRMYERFCELNWSQLLSDIRDQLIPKMVDIVAIAWGGALAEAGLLAK